MPFLGYVGGGKEKAFEMLAQMEYQREERQRRARLEDEQKAAADLQLQQEQEGRQAQQDAYARFQAREERFGRGTSMNPEPFDFRKHGQVDAEPYKREVPMSNLAMEAARLAIDAERGGLSKELINDLLPLWQRAGLGGTQARQAIEVENELAPDGNTRFMQDRLRDEFREMAPFQIDKTKAETAHARSLATAAEALGRHRVEQTNASRDARTPGTPTFAPPSPPRDPVAEARDNAIRKEWSLLREEEGGIAAKRGEVAALLAGAQGTAPKPGLMTRMRPGAPPQDPEVRRLQAHLKVLDDQLREAQRKRTSYETSFVQRYLPEAGLVGGAAPAGGSGRGGSGRARSDARGEEITREELEEMGYTEEQAAAAGLVVVD